MGIFFSTWLVLQMVQVGRISAAVCVVCQFKMLISEIRSSHEIDPQFDEAIASPAGKFLPELTFFFIVLKTDGLCPCLTAASHSWLWRDPFSCKQLFPIRAPPHGLGWLFSVFLSQF